jgi:hypothetical protein
MMNKWMGKLAQRALKGCGALALLGMLASCGGGTEQVTPFAPTRMLVFGDEMSVMTKLPPQGRKYSVNALITDGTDLDCWPAVDPDTRRRLPVRLRGMQPDEPGQHRREDLRRTRGKGR